MFCFTIRDVLWLTVVVAFGVSWWLDHTKTRIDWEQVRADRQALAKATELAHWANVRADTAIEQRTKIIRAAARFGMSYLDVEPETKINRELLDVDD